MSSSNAKGKILNDKKEKLEQSVESMARYTELDEGVIQFHLKYSPSSVVVDFLIQKLEEMGTRPGNNVSGSKRCMGLLVDKEIKRAIENLDGTISDNVVEIWHDYRRKKL